MPEYNFTEEELKNNKESIISAVKLTIFSYEEERDKINKELKRARTYLKKIKGA